MISVLAAIGVAGVGLVFLIGLLNTMRGGDPQRSQRLMRWRVGAQFAVVVIIVALLWLAAKL
jgi:hypothetical protein